MKTFEELKTVFTHDLLELEKLAGIWPSTIEKRHVKEQEIGRHCYEAKEDLSQLELNTLKRALGINDTRWRAFKAKFIAGSSPEELAQKPLRWINRHRVPHVNNSPAASLTRKILWLIQELGRL